MSVIKIISNPYEMEISYQRWDENSEDWVPITVETNNMSQLVSDELTKGFFTFKVKKIVETVVSEYGEDNKAVEIEFEGTEDEFRELLLVCSEMDGKVSAVKGTCFLENARDILPDVIDTFKNVRAVVQQSITGNETIEKNLEKFSEASSNEIPIVVMGNYSTGKSTFINALIGSEVLPSGSEPVTAKVYKITPSKFDDRAAIRTSYDKTLLKITFTEKEWKYNNGHLDGELIERLDEGLTPLKDKPMSVRLSKALEILNQYESDTEDDMLSEIIELEVPFNGGLLGKAKDSFVIFDTPGSNTASNEKHIKVLKHALEGMTNGLPVYVSEFHNLDSIDNENLYNQIHSMEALDTRFTMIVVNKADTAKLPSGGFTETDEKKILSEGVPRNLYSGGIYFVSSIMGLGSKLDGEFVDDFFAEKYEELHSKFSDSGSRFYKTLYKFNIMPGQIKQHLMEDVSGCDDPVFANSGLYSVEREMEIFAGKYASYNKCNQSKHFLNSVIGMTHKNIEEKQKETENQREGLLETLKKEERELIEQLENKSKEMEDAFIADYTLQVGSSVDQDKYAFSESALKEREAQLTAQYETQYNYSDYQENLKTSWANVGSNLRKNFSEVVENEDRVARVKALGINLGMGLKETKEREDERKAVRKQIDTETANQILEETKGKYQDSCITVRNEFDSSSKNYWTEKTEEFRKELAKIILGNSTLDHEQKDELSQLILTYQELAFEDHAEEIFNKGDFSREIRIGGFVIAETAKLNIRKLTATYTERLDGAINDCYHKIEKSHGDSFKKWKDELLRIIKSQIVEFSPQLRSQNQAITECEMRIKDMVSRQQQLEQYEAQIARMMAWKNVNV